VVNQDTNFVPELKKAALALKTGEVTPQPVKSEFGYHIIKAGEKKEASVIPFDEAKAQIKSELEKNKSDQTFNTYLENLKKKATIKDLRSK
jgi:peptidyl-prolyl cis-trans isomerase C/foldase protein PrsA